MKRLYLTPKTIRGRTRWFVRSSYTEDGRRRERYVEIHAKPGTPEFDAEYWHARRKRNEPKKKERYTWGEAIKEWREDPRVQIKLAQSTKVGYRRDMDRIAEKNGEKDMRGTTRKAVRAAHARLSDTPRKADKYLSVISILWNYAAQKLDWPLGENPTVGIDRYNASQEYEPWPDWMVKSLEHAPSPVRTAAELILGTGQRPSAAISMKWDQFNGDWMRVTDEKGDDDFEVFCPGQLRAYLNTIPKSGAHILAKNLTQPRGYDSIEKAFRTWREMLGESGRKYTLHGLRKLSIVRLAEAGWTDAEIQAVTNQSAEMVAFYRKRASRKIMTRKAWERNE